MEHILAANAAVIDREIVWFRAVLDSRFRSHTGQASASAAAHAPAPPELPSHSVPYSDVIRRFNMGPAERLVLILAYLPHIRPETLDPFLIQNESLHRRFTEFGGVVGAAHGGFLPTAETAMFLLAGNYTRARLHHLHLFHPDHYFFRLQILRSEGARGDVAAGIPEPRLSTPLLLTPEFLELLTTGRDYHPPFSDEFPARQISTEYEWDDLVLDNAARRDVEDIIHWVRFHKTLLEDWKLAGRIKPGYRSLFYGPPGTGKTLTAMLLGKATGMPVFRVDLSSVISKYIGETEKNLASLFDHAGNRGWILFFDEADSLFGKRTETRNSNDRAANQQISYLLQRIEDFPGVVILASNMKSHIDEAFSRRFQSIIHFSMPDYAQRLRLWEDNFTDKPYRLPANVNIAALARDHEISGGNIVNVLRYACLKAVARGSESLRLEDIVQAVRNERHKEGRFQG